MSNQIDEQLEVEEELDYNSDTDREDGEMEVEVDADADVHFQVEAVRPVNELAEQFARVAMVVRNGLRDGIAMGQLPQQAPRGQQQPPQQAPQQQQQDRQEHRRGRPIPVLVGRGRQERRQPVQRALAGVVDLRVWLDNRRIQRLLASSPRLRRLAIRHFSRVSGWENYAPGCWRRTDFL